mmetsp:Transcript_84730/g.244946  ORF Transcript_84730/g.244946 Transcript_84730/m.244946 type:complete len:221 (-) Transcript_84730:112-774(-)
MGHGSEGRPWRRRAHRPLGSGERLRRLPLLGLGAPGLAAHGLGQRLARQPGGVGLRARRHRRPAALGRRLGAHASAALRPLPPGPRALRRRRALPAGVARGHSQRARAALEDHHSQGARRLGGGGSSRRRLAGTLRVVSPQGEPVPERRGAEVCGLPRLEGERHAGPPPDERGPADQALGPGSRGRRARAAASQERAGCGRRRRRLARRRLTSRSRHRVL